MRAVAKAKERGSTQSSADRSHGLLFLTGYNSMHGHGSELSGFVSSQLFHDLRHACNKLLVVSDDQKLRALRHEAGGIDSHSRLLALTYSATALARSLIRGVPPLRPFLANRRRI